jgi:ABC-type lipoprotein export system ATPase subunit
VAIARAMVHEPQILFADEPTGNLDSKVKCHILDDLQSLNEKENVTVVLVTHDEETAKYARRTVRILDGQIYEDIKGGQL